MDRRENDRTAQAAKPAALIPPYCSATSPHMSDIKRICVYCGSGPGKNPKFAKSATAFGKILATNGIGLVYGGGAIGLMGVLAKATIAIVVANARCRSPTLSSRVRYAIFSLKP